MIQIRGGIDFFDACSTSYGLQELEAMPKVKALNVLYRDVKKDLKSFYMEPKDAFDGFEDPVSKKHCWITGNIPFAKLGLTWDEALYALQAVYADCPLLFFSDKYRTGGSPSGGYLAPVVDAECARGDFRRFYATKIEEEIRATVKNIPAATACRDAALAVYRQMVKTASYDHSKGDGERIKYVDTPSHSILNYVRNRSGVCQGFAETYQAIMNYITIPAVMVTVNTNEGPHAVNLIYLTDEKKWILVDSTTGITNKNDDIANQNDIGFDMSASIYKPYPRTPSGDEYHFHMPEQIYAWGRFLGK